MRSLPLVALILLSGCSSSQLVSSEAGAPSETSPPSVAVETTSSTINVEQAPLVPSQLSSGAQERVLNVTPHILVERNTSGQTVDFWDDTYTRVRVTAKTLGNAPSGLGVDRNYDAERRNAIARFFVGKTLSANLTFRVDISGERPAFSSVVPVVAMSHISNSETGEAWSTDIYGQSVNKLVRIRAGSKISVGVELARSKSADSQIIQSALNVAREATKVIAPESDLLTTFTKNSADKEAKIWDSALGKLFSQSLSEKVLSDSLLHEFLPDTPIVSVQLRLPRNLDSNGLNDAMEIGSWDVSLDCPTRSLFIPARRVASGNSQAVTCQVQVKDIPADFKLSPERVLGYPLSDNTTIYSYLLASPEFNTRLQDVAAATSQTLPAEAKKMCSAILGAGEGLGLTRIDSNLLLWAVTQRFPITAKESAIRTACYESYQTISQSLTVNNQ